MSMSLLKLPWSYKLLFAVPLVAIVAVAIWAGITYGSTSSNATTTAFVSSAPTLMPTAIPSSSPTGPSAAPSTSSISSPSSSSYLYLDTTELANFSTAKSWNITKVSHGASSSLHQITVDPVTKLGNVLKVNYPAGSYKPAASIVGGMGVFACPPSIFPAKSVKLSYELYFPADFDPVKGGKLPGLFIGPPGADGGHHVSNEASCRIMWRENNAKGGFMTEAYVYIAETQDPSYYTLPSEVLDPTDGDSLWRGLVNYNKGSWNQIHMALTLNTMTSGVANPDGFLNLTVNGVSEHSSKFIFTSGLSSISGIIFTTFFGGADNSWATPVATSSYFKNFHVQKLA